MSAPAAEGVRLPYADLPAAVREWVSTVLGDRVVEAVTQPGGFSPGVAARLRTAGGRRAFVKAVSGEVNPQTPGMHRREARISAALPVGAPAPRLLASYDDGRWVALLLEDVPGRHPHLPWRPDELARVVAGVDDLLDALTPCPLSPVEDVADGWREEFAHWRRAAAAGPPAGLDGWAAGHLDRLAALEDGCRSAAAGDTLLHFDLRADNLLVTDDRVWVVDWPWASRGAAVLDLVAFAPSVRMQGGPAPADLLEMSRHGRAADPAAVAPLVAAVSGYLVCQALAPPPPGLPTVRAFQAAQGEVALAWLRELTGWR